MNKKFGYAKAANQAIKPDTEFILMFQADGIIDQGDISKLLEAHKNTIIPSLYHQHCLIKIKIQVLIQDVFRKKN